METPDKIAIETVEFLETKTSKISLDDYIEVLNTIRSWVDLKLELANADKQLEGR